jgi:hypothetical protein
MWFILKNVPMIMAGWFWLIFFASLFAWLILPNITGCTHEELGIRCYPGTWYGQALEISNVWILIAILLAAAVIDISRIASPSAFLHITPLAALALSSFAVLLLGTAMLAFSTIRRCIRLARRWI